MSQNLTGDMIGIQVQSGELILFQEYQNDNGQRYVRFEDIKNHQQASPNDWPGLGEFED